MAKIPYITLSDTINTSRIRINQLIDSVGDLSLLTTDDSATIVGAINFLDSNAGRKTALTTTAKTSIVAGINEHDAELGTITAAAMKARLGASTVSAAIAEIHDSIGAGSLTTSTKTLVGAINEHDTELGTITTAAMKVKGTASTVSGALAAISDSIGSGPLTTTVKTLVGAINEHDTELGTITTAGMKTKLGAATVSAAIAELNDSIGYGILNTTSKTLIGAINELQDSIGSGGLTTTVKTLVGAINEHDTELGTITIAAMKVKGTASTVSGALAAISDSIGSGPLTTVATTLVGAINEHEANNGRKVNLSTPITTNLVNAINYLDSNTGRKTNLGTPISNNLVGAINFLDSNAGRKSNLTTSVKTSLAAAINSVKDSSASVTGPLGSLSTPITTNLVNAINFLDSNAGRKANLKTTVKTSLLAGINEIQDSIGYGGLSTNAKTLVGAIAELDSNAGRKANLSTPITTNLVNAINFLDSNAGRKANLTTTAKTSIVAGVNEHDAELGTITAAAMKTRGGASTVSTAIAQIFDSIGSAALSTTSKTLVGAINEHDTEIGVISNLSTPITTNLVNAINFLDSNAGRKANLTTSTKTSIVAAVNELKTREDTTQSHVVDSAGQLLLKSNNSLSAKFTNANVQFQGYVTSLTALYTVQQDYSGAINELKSTINTITGQTSVDSGISNTVGSLSSLSTPITSTIVAAINFLDSNAGRKANLTTTSKTTIVAGVNELKSRLDSINAAGVGTPQLKALGVTTAKIADNNVTLAKLPLATTGKRVIASTASGVIYSEQQVDSDMIGSLAIPAAKIQSNAITTAKIIDSAVSTSKIQLNAITTTKIADLNITTGKLAANAVSYDKMQTSSAANRVVGATSAGSQLGEVQINSLMILAGAVDSAALKANVVTLGTKTTGQYVSTITAGTGISFSAGAGTGAGSTPTIAIGQAVGTSSNVTFNDVTVSGNLIVNGTTTSINTETVTLNDNIIVLNNNATGIPGTNTAFNAGIEVERGDSANVLVLWNEATNRWGFTNDGSTYYNLPITSELYDSARVVTTIGTFDKYPTTYAWTGGTTAGPTGSLTGANNMAAVSFGAIPSASASASGIVTTGAQTFAGVKTFSSTITGSVDGNAGTVTNGVYTTGDQTIGGTKTFSNTITGSVSGNAGTVTNGFYTSSSFNLGTTSIAVNRASAIQSLTGISIDGNAGTATTLATGRNFSLTGPITAAAISFNGSGAVALATAITAGAVDSSAHGALSVSAAKIQSGAVSSAKLASAVTLIIYNSAGTAVKTLYGAGA